MALLNRTDRKKSEELRDIAKSKKTKLTLGDLIIPFASAAAFAILSFAVFIPMVRSAFEYRGEMKVIEGKIEQLKKLDEQLKRIDEDVLRDDVLTAKKVVPNILLVSDLVYYLDNLAKSLSLEISKLASSDALDSVSGPIAYEGEYNNIISFLDEAQNVSPYMLRLENVELSSSRRENNSDVWEIELTVSGYYIADGSGEKIDIYSPFQPYTEYEDIVEVFKVKTENRL